MFSSARAPGASTAAARAPQQQQSGLHIRVCIRFVAGISVMLSLAYLVLFIMLYVCISVFLVMWVNGVKNEASKLAGTEQQ